MAAESKMTVATFIGRMLSYPLVFLGEQTKHFVVYLGGIAWLAIEFFKAIFQPPLIWDDIRNQCQKIGLSSLPIALTFLFFVGLVFAFQFGFTLETMGAVPYIGNVTSLSVVRELGPVFTALVVGSRVGAGIASELASMKVTEQIDAIKALGASPYKKLLVPRVVAATLMLPILNLCATASAIIAAMFISWFEFGLSFISFYQSAVSSVYLTDFSSGFFKPIFFGFGIGIIGCYEGMHCSSGTVGVGKATTKAAVNIAIMVMLVDFLLTRFFALFPRI